MYNEHETNDYNYTPTEQPTKATVNFLAAVGLMVGVGIGISLHHKHNIDLKEAPLDTTQCVGKQDLKTIAHIIRPPPPGE